MTRKAPSHWPISILSSLSSLVNMFVPLVMVRLLPPEQIGVFKIFFLYAMMSPTISFVAGLGSGLGFWAGQGERGRRAIQLSNLMILGLATSLGLICVVATPLLVAAFQWPAIYGVYFGAAVIGTICFNFLEESAIVTGRTWFGAISLSASEIIRSVILVTVAWITRDLGTILFAYAIISLVKVGAAMVLALREKLLSFRIDRAVIQDIWKYSFPVSTAWFFSIFSRYGDQMILSSVLSPASFAIYVTCCLSVPPLMIIEQSVTRVMIPQLSAAFAAGDQTTAAAIYRRAVQQLSWLLIPAVTGLIIFASPIVNLLFTNQYAEGVIYLRWFALSYLFLIFPDDAVPRARGEGTWILRTFMLLSPIPLVLCYGLGMTYSAGGALAGLLISRAVARGYAMAYVRRSTGWSFGRFLPLGSLATYAGVCAALALPCLALEHVLGGGLLWFAVCGGLFTVAYFTGTLAVTNWLARRRPLREGNILLFSQHLRVGGLERLVLTLGQTLRQDPRWKLFLFSHDSDENAQSYTDQSLIGDFLKADIQVDALQKKAGFSFVTLYRLIRNLYRNDIHVIHSHDLGTLIYAVIAKLCSLGKARIVHTQHSFVHLQRFKHYGRYERIFTMFVDTLTVVNEGMVQSYVDLGVPRKRVHVVSNGVSFSEEPVRNRDEKIARRRFLMASLGAGERALLEPVLTERWVLYLARFHSVKGQREAARLWTEMAPALRRKSVLVLVGPEAQTGERAEVLKLFAGVPDRDRVIFLDGTRVPQEWLASADLFLSCSKFEGMPLGPLEAIGSGLPAVLSAIPGHAFLDRSSGQFSLEMPADGAARVADVLDSPGFGSPEFYAGLWKDSAWIREQYSLDAMAQRYATFYTGRAS